MPEKAQGDLVTTLGGLLFFGEQCLRQKITENRLQQLEMKPHRFSRRYPDWRLDGARNDDLAGGESLAKAGKQRGNSPPELLSAEVFDFGDTVMMVAREQRPEAKSYFTPLLSDYALWYSLVMTNSRCPRASAQVKRPLQVRSMMSIN